MVNFRDPDVFKSDIRANTMLSHAVGGLYIWEFITHLDYEWSIIRGHRPYRWTIWIYSTARLATLLAVIVNLVLRDVTILTPTSCRIWMIFQFVSPLFVDLLFLIRRHSVLPDLTHFQVFAYMTFSLSSLLIVLRIIAIWNWNKFVMAFAVATWLTNASFLIEGTTQVRAEWVPDFPSDSCGPINVKGDKLWITAMLVTDVALLFTMIIGLLRLRHHGGGRFDLGRLLWKQVFIFLNLNGSFSFSPAFQYKILILLQISVLFDHMFMMPSLITMSIAATRIYRSLADFVFHNDVVNGSDNPPKIDHTISDIRWTNTIPVPRNRIEAVTNISHERRQSPASQIGHYVPYTSSDGELGDHLRVLNLDDDVESSAE
ncbi:hypothetical protein BC827DRAFT_1383527 [Russula dissimulans]|nr:hypothetical protein BC827DRAFT_1383527 [Russula dissimulans]